MSLPPIPPSSTSFTLPSFDKIGTHVKIGAGLVAVTLVIGSIYSKVTKDSTGANQTLTTVQIIILRLFILFIKNS